MSQYPTPNPSIPPPQYQQGQNIQQPSAPQLQSQQSQQTPQNISGPTNSKITATSLPKGQMPIEQVFRMMWARMNQLEEMVKESGSSEGIVSTSRLNDEDISSIRDLKNQTDSANSSMSLELNTLKDTSEEIMVKVASISSELESIKKTLTDTISNFNSTMAAVGADLTEMNSKYTQMNNFLMEIQTTQITVNNQILKHYNDNYSDLVESQIEKSAAEKFNAKETENHDSVVDSNDVSGTESNQESLNLTVTNDIPTTGNKVTFNIE